MDSLRDELGRLFMLSFGVFLFILFFQPFPLETFDYNNRLLFVTGFGAITFFKACIVYILLPLMIPKWHIIDEWEGGPPTLLSFLFLTLTSTAFAFYIRYVAEVQLSLYIMFKVVLVCLLPLLILIILYKNKSLKRIISILQDQNKYYFSKIGEYEKIAGEEEVDIISDNKSDNLSLKYNHIVFIKSADNYIEIYYLVNELLEKKLLRSTLKNLELQLTKNRSFIRCHRTSIVNIMYIDKLVQSYSGYSLKMSCLEETIPVARQYLLQVKEAIAVSG